MLQQQLHIRNALSRAGLKATPQRMLLYNALCAETTHPTAEELYSKVNAKLPGLSLGTVYSTLETLVKNNLASRVPVAEGKMRYDGRIDGHHHLYCTNTNEIIDFDDPELAQIILEHLKKKKVENFTIDSIILNICGQKTEPERQIKFSDK